MKDFLKGKFATGLVVVATVILAGVAIFTALQLYKLRAPNAPDSSPYAWDCSKYKFSVSSTGTVSVQNLSSRDESSQQAKIYINGTLVETLDVPALPIGQSRTLGSVEVPSSGVFSWKVEGTVDCSNSGAIAESCKLLTFTITGNSPTITPTTIPGSTATPISTLTPTDSPGVSNTPTPTGSVSSTPTPTEIPGSTATPTSITVRPPSIASPPTCDSLKPAAPILTSVKKSGTQAVLTWTKVELATHYVISYGLTPENLQYGVPNTGNVNTFTIGSLNSSSTYYFTVYAVNNCMPSDGSTIISSVAGTSTSASSALPTSGTRATLPDAGNGIITIATFGTGIALIVFALLLAI